MSAKELTPTELDELRAAFADVLNYDSEDPTAPIDPLTYRAPDGDTCLHIAAIRGDYRSAQLLLKAGLHPNARGDMSQTPLHCAKRNGHDDIAALLVSRGALTDVTDEFGKTAAEL
jgi:ankyrin repeat protein